MDEDADGTVQSGLHAKWATYTQGGLHARWATRHGGLHGKISCRKGRVQERGPHGKVNAR